MSTVTLGNVSCPFSLTMFVSFLFDDFPCQWSLYFLQARRNFSLPPSCHKVNIHMYESFVYTSVSDHCDEISEMSTSSVFKQISPLSLSLIFELQKKKPHTKITLPFTVLLGFLLLNMIFIVPFVSFLVFLLDGTILCNSIHK